MTLVVSSAEFVFGGVTVAVGDTGDTHLLVGGAGLLVTGAVVVEDTLNTNTLSNGAGRLVTGAVIVVNALTWFSAEAIVTVGLLGFVVSPVLKRTVGVLGTLNTASTVEVAVWETVGGTLFVASTVVDTDSVGGITVKLTNVFATISSTAGFTSVSAIVTGSISTTVGVVSVTVGVLGARSALLGGWVTDWLVLEFTTVIRSTKFVGGASGAASILVTVGLGRTVGVFGTRANTEFRAGVTESLSRLVTTPGVSGSSTVSVGFTVEADSVVHAVSTLGSSAAVVTGASISAESRGT